ncbi:MAG: complex I NDUFA9 subunit family protein [Burkholderiales bacterium]|jgi:NADH dehydrogenase|nr:complex I NDUFA9 subunit family protein [Burkholderiales bacterium]
MTASPVCLIGGSGFLGSHVASQLAARGIALRIPTRNRERAKDPLILLPTTEVRRLDVHAPADLAAAVAGCHAVVNLVGVLHDARRDGFARNHVELPARIARACRDAGVARLVHVSAVGAAAQAPSAYLRSKAEGERALRAEAGDVGVTVLRPSVVFGREDRFLNLFADLAALFPVLPLAGADARFQPVYVEDVARVITDAVTGPRRDDGGDAIELCGPREYTLGELVRWVCAQRGLARPVVPLPGALAALQAFVLEHLPGHVMTRDNLRSMQVPNVCACRFEDVAGFAPTALEAVAPAWLARARPRDRYMALRVRTRR